MKESIFNWKKYLIWGKKFSEFLNILLPSDILSQFKKNKEEIYFDWVGSFELIIHDENDNCYFEKEFKDFFIKTFSHVLTYHGCRPVDTQSYYKDGLLVLDKTVQNTYFEKIFLNKKHKEVTQNDIMSVIDQMSTQKRENQLFVGLDDRSLIEYSGHYLIYGSEYLMCMAVRLSERIGKDYRPFLKYIGTPTIFSVNLPVSLIEDSDLSQLFQVMYRVWVYNQIKNQNDSYHIDFTFFLQNNIPSENIISHYHPDKIPDYHKNGKIYNRNSLVNRVIGKVFNYIA